MPVLLLAVAFVSAVFTLLWGGAAMLAQAWRATPARRGIAEQLAPSVDGSVADEAEEWLRRR